MSSLGVELGDKKNAIAWLTDKSWIVLSYSDDGFPRYLEDNYFTPGTPKNAEFEVLIAPVKHQGRFGVMSFFRIKDTVENREVLRAALAEFYKTPLLSYEKLESAIAQIRRGIRESVILMLR